MKLVRSVVLPAIGCGLVLLSFGGCGGNTFEGSGNGAMGGTSGAGAQSGNAGNGGSGNGGSGGGGAAGTAGSAGSAVGGGAGALGAGSGGAAGTGGAAGAGGLPPEWLACSDTSECLVRESSCCPECGPDDANRAVAFNRDYAGAVNRALCGSIAPPCPAIACEQAPAYVLPFCIEGRCQAIDIRKDKLTSCSTEAQCRLRWGTTCCEPCGSPPPVMLVAVNSQVNYDQTVCGTGTGCPDCVTAGYPTVARALCGPDNHCTVGWLR